MEHGIDGTPQRRVEPAHVRNARAHARHERTEAVPRIITLAREYGAGGEEVARLVAQALGFTLWDEQLVRHVAERAGADAPSVHAIDERQRALLDDVIDTSLRGASISGATYRTALVRVVRELSERGAAVIVGRGASFLVRPEDGLRVRVVCPFSERIRRVHREEHLSMFAAARFVRGKDQQRERFVRQLVGEKRGADPMHYDVLVNTSELSPEQAARFVIDAYCARFGETRAN